MFSQHCLYLGKLNQSHIHLVDLRLAFSKLFFWVNRILPILLNIGLNEMQIFEIWKYRLYKLKSNFRFFYIINRKKKFQKLSSNKKTKKIRMNKTLLLALVLVACVATLCQADDCLRGCEKKNPQLGQPCYRRDKRTKTNVTVTNSLCRTITLESNPNKTRPACVCTGGRFGELCDWI